MIRFSRNPIRPLLYSFGLAFGILFGMEPFEFFPAGGLGAACAYLLFWELREWSIRSTIYWLLLLSQIINLVVFFWIPSSITAISGAGPLVSWVVFLVYGLFSHIKLFLFFFGWNISLKVYSKYRKSSKEKEVFAWAIFPIWGVFTDMITPQLFPWFWGNLGEGNLSFSQIASFAGVYGVGFFLLLGTSSLVLWKNLSIRKFAYSGILIFGLVWTLGGLRLYLAPNYEVPNSTPKVENDVLKLSAVLLQPNTSPGKRELAENPEFVGQTISTSLELGLRSSLETSPPPDILFIPESAIPFHGTIPSDPASPSVYSSTFHGAVTYLTYKTGADVLYNELNQFPEGLKNQVTLLSSNTGEFQRYDKRRLLAFGEYIPFESVFPFLRSLFKETSRYVTGGDPKPLQGERFLQRQRWPSPPTEAEISLIQNPENFRPISAEMRKEEKVQYQILPLICYEAMFPALTQDSVKSASNDTYTFLANPTNDSWFSSRIEAWQHAGAARFRAIEYGLSFVRPAVTGISFAVDPYGRSLNHPTQYGEKVTDSFLLPITKLKAGGNTFFAKWGNIPFLLYSILIASLFPLMGKRFLAETSN
ncbi:apolipoprotein N-acyltransferase [Leptospira langatensis]|uniref:Apolipoprotein N-acyltransferase n=1 Tax=Leptospira langatensis TaxID=2484983 RepID=A0A5F1ZR40_9LEPT|nr:apolipoprotein N-acyltransferase [Leptospira langatensis]TGK02676.1 apolipoprotein N-acyltransferase [Leptospira langatensis]TGL40121.1 apolipoprotein N-acyltransferase [Leptospira langatensis]